MNRRMPRLTLALFILLTGVRAATAQTHLMTEADFSALPPECNAKLRGDLATQGLWRQRIGDPHFLHLHHYCFGLFFMNRGMVTLEKRQRVEHLRESINQFQYVIDRWPPSSSYRQAAQQYQANVRLVLSAIQPSAGR